MDVVEHLLARPGAPVIVDDGRCPRCGAMAGDPIAESGAVGQGGTPCTRGDKGAIWVEWYECPGCGKRFSAITGG